ncbi:MAG: hypothetical protein WDN09_03130 [bacterium]
MIEFQKLLNEQSSVKVVLNGGSQELNDATIPFTIGMDDYTADRKPTHVLVIDISHSMYKNLSVNPDLETDIALHRKVDLAENTGERKIYELNKIDFIQFNRPGKHNLIFILFSRMDNDTKKAVLQKTSLRSTYEKDIDFSYIEVGYNSDQVGYCEALVEIPEHFFAIRPTSGLKRKWYGWVNRWFLTDPVDQCDFRKRAILALTIQPIAWFLGFFVRFVVSVPLGAVMTAWYFISPLVGQQSSRYFLTKLKALYWNFLFLYYKHCTCNWKEVCSGTFWFGRAQKYKRFVFGSKVLNVVISPAGIALQLFLWYRLVHYIISIEKVTFATAKSSFTPVLNLFATLSIFALIVFHLVFVIITLPHLKSSRAKKLKELHVKFAWKNIMVFSSIVLTYFTIVQTPWRKLFQEIRNLFSEISYRTVELPRTTWMILVVPIVLILLYMFRRSFRKPVAAFIDAVSWSADKLASYMPVRKAALQGQHGDMVADVLVEKKKLTHSEWLKENMNIHNMPDKVDLKAVVAPTKKEQIIQKFKVSFWSAKSKVCRPYAK